MKACCCCGTALLRHIRWHKEASASRIYWYCMYCHQEMPLCNTTPASEGQCLYRANHAIALRSLIRNNPNLIRQPYLEQSMPVEVN